MADWRRRPPRRGCLSSSRVCGERRMRSKILLCWMFARQAMLSVGLEQVKMEARCEDGDEPSELRWR